MFQAQKPWAKKYSKVIKAKKEYYNACKLDRAAAAQEKTLRGVPDTAADQVLLVSLCCIIWTATFVILIHICKTSSYATCLMLSKIGIFNVFNILSWVHITVSYASVLWLHIITVLWPLYGHLC